MTRLYKDLLLVVPTDRRLRGRVIANGNNGRLEQHHFKTTPRGAPSPAALESVALTLLDYGPPEKSSKTAKWSSGTL
jgi:hypothetical protein